MQSKQYDDYPPNFCQPGLKIVQELTSHGEWNTDQHKKAGKSQYKKSAVNKNLPAAGIALNLCSPYCSAAKVTQIRWHQRKHTWREERPHPC